mgnify:CR=1 FL=1
MSSGKIRVSIKHDETEVEFEGGYEEVWKSINRYFSETYPALETIKALTGLTDVADLAEKLKGLVEFREGRIIILGELEAKRKILLCLAAAYVGKALGLFEKDKLTPKEIAAYTGLDERVTRARLSELRRAGLVIRSEEGLYGFTSTSLNELFGEKR